MNRFLSAGSIVKQIMKSKITGKRIPVLVSLHITNRCNLRCKYCYADYYGRFNKPPKDFTLAEVKAMIDEMYEVGTRWLIILGGEPLLRDDIGDIISYAKEKGMFCELITNGTLIKNRIDAIKEVDLLCISLDGDEIANNSVRGCYKKTIEGIEAASQHGIKTRLHAVLTKFNNNKRCLNHLSDLAEKYSSIFGYSTPYVHEYKKVSDLVVSDKEEREFWKMARKMKEDGCRIYNTYSALDYMLSWPLHITEILFDKKSFSKLGGFKPKPCFVGSRSCYIDSEGFLYPCVSMGVKTGLNVKEVGFKKAWEYLKDFQCGACAYIQYIELNDALDLKPHSIILALKSLLGWF